MKRFLVRAGAIIGRFFWSWGFLKFVIGFVMLMVLLYAEEDWRGAHAWAVTKAKWEAKGESFDYQKFIPPLISDDQNLAALPLFNMEAVQNPDGSSVMVPVALQNAMHRGSPVQLPSVGNWMKGQLPNLAEIHKGVAEIYSAVTKKPASSSGSSLDQFVAVYQPIISLIGETDRPVFLLKESYSNSTPVLRPLGAIVAGITLSQILTMHSILSLEMHDPDGALKDIETNYKILCGIKSDPTLVGGLVALGVAAITDAGIFDGLANHLWSDAQLADIEKTLGSVDFLAGYQFAMRSESAETVATIDYFKHLPASKRSHLIGVYLPLLSGWLDLNKCQLIDFHLSELAAVDPKAHRVFPNISMDNADHVMRYHETWRALLPWNIWFIAAARAEIHIMQKYAEAQVWLDEARIACALERYHLAHGVYPESLEALIPACIDALPHDIMNGKPYHYKLRPDGTFLLYSVGWNLTDDGGVAIFTDPDHSGHSAQDYEQGDWVWPTPK
jgi:hypothetical protein